MIYRLIEGFEDFGIRTRDIHHGNQSPCRGLAPSELLGWSHKCYSATAGTGTERMFVLPNDGPEGGEWVLGLKDAIDARLLQDLAILGGKVLVSGGHYVPDLEEFNRVQGAPLAGLSEAGRIAREVHRNGQAFDFLITVNDILMIGEQRAYFYANFVLPADFLSEFQALESDTSSFTVFIVSESKLAERLNREKRVLAKAGKLQRMPSGEYQVLHEGGPITLIAHGQQMAAKCIRAYARLAGLPATLGYSGYLQVLPRCANNAHLGYEIGRQLYRGVPTLLVYRTVTCW